MSLRGGNAVDDYDLPPPYDATLDRPDEVYLESFHWGIHHLDAESWHHYLPLLLEHSLAKLESSSSAAVDTFLFSLRPPDREPPRFGRLTPGEVEIVVSVLEALGFSQGSVWQEPALQALQEYWHDRGT